MVPRYNISLEEERELALRRLQRICDNKFISVKDFWNNPLRVFAAHELAAIIDPAMTTKMTVQFNLFGGTVLKLGTDRHHKELLEGIDNLNDIGCFGLTELGYGNNAVEMETTATYDASTKEFIVNTPNTLAQKYWITNGACHAKHIVVFAQLIVDGKKQRLEMYNVELVDAGEISCSLGDTQCSGKLEVEEPKVNFVAKLPAATTGSFGQDVRMTVKLSSSSCNVKWMR